MADGTTGLGQPTTVFDFSGIAQLGLQVDQINEQRAQKKSAQFQASNKDLMDTQGISLGKVRDVDRAYLQKKLNEFQELSAQAYRTEDPAVAQQARALKSQIAERVSVSSMLQSNDFAESAKFAEAEDRGYYVNQLNQHRQNTAMTDDNDGLIDPVAVKYTFVPEKDLIKGNLADATATYVGAVKETATSTTADGTTRTNKDKVLSEANKKYDVFSQTAEGKLYVKEAYFQDKFGIERFKESDTVRMEEMIAASEQLHTQFDNVEQIQEAYKNDKARAREMTELFNLKNDMDDWGRNKFVTELEARIGYTERQAKVDTGGTSASEDYGVNMALSFEQLLGEDADLSQVPNVEAMTNRALGKASTKGGTLKSIGKGKNAVYYEGITAVLSPDAEFNEDGELIDGTVDYLLNTRVPAEDELTQIIQLQKEGKDMNEIFNLIDFKLMPRPLNQLKGDIPQGQLNQMKSLALQQAMKAQEQLIEAAK